jgi:hypothetical protein
LSAKALHCAPEGAGSRHSSTENCHGHCAIDHRFEGPAKGPDTVIDAEHELGTRPSPRYPRPPYPGTDLAAQSRPLTEIQWTAVTLFAST